MPVHAQGKAGRGSQLWLQTFVNELPHALNEAIVAAINGPARPTIKKWLSPLEAENYSEYQDQDFLDKLGVELTDRRLDSFWPARGPVWDGLARTSDDEVILVEAKSHIREAVSPPTDAKGRSLELIRNSLDETKSYLNGNPHADWAGIFYQVTNRLAHLYLLKVLNNVHAHLVFVYFVGDKDMKGPATVDEWKGAVRTIEAFLGIGRSKLSPFVHHVYLDVDCVRRD